MDGDFTYASPEVELGNVLSRQFEKNVHDMPVLDRCGALRGVVKWSLVLKTAPPSLNDELSQIPRFPEQNPFISSSVSFKAFLTRHRAPLSSRIIID